MQAEGRPLGGLGGGPDCPGSYTCGTWPTQPVGIRLAMAGSLLTTMVAFGTVGSGRPPKGPECSEGAAKRLDALLPTAHPVSHVS